MDSSALPVPRAPHEGAKSRSRPPGLRSSGVDCLALFAPDAMGVALLPSPRSALGPEARVGAGRVGARLASLAHPRVVVAHVGGSRGKTGPTKTKKQKSKKRNGEKTAEGASTTTTSSVAAAPVASSSATLDALEASRTAGRNRRDAKAAEAAAAASTEPPAEAARRREFERREEDRRAVLPQARRGRGGGRVATRAVPYGGRLRSLPPLGHHPCEDVPALEEEELPSAASRRRRRRAIPRGALCGGTQ